MVLTLDGFDQAEMSALRAIWTEEPAMPLNALETEMLAALKAGRGALAAWMDIADDEDQRDDDYEALAAMDAAIANAEAESV